LGSFSHKKVTHQLFIANYLVLLPLLHFEMHMVEECDREKAKLVRTRGTEQAARVLQDEEEEQDTWNAPW
jgi:hypothetical protein